MLWVPLRTPWALLRLLVKLPWALPLPLPMLLPTPPRALLMQPLAQLRMPKRRCNLRLFGKLIWGARATSRPFSYAVCASAVRLDLI